MSFYWIHVLLISFAINNFLQGEVNLLSSELRKANQTVVALQGEADRARAGQEKRVGLLVRKYGELYAQTRLETMEGLDSLPELNGLDDLKSKLLFSVIVVSKNNTKEFNNIYLGLKKT